MKIKRRSEEMIISEILEICEGGVGKTKIVYQANLNSQRVDHYLMSLVKNGLITRESRGSRVEYRTTQRGTEIKEKLQRLQTEIDELNTSFNVMTY